MRWTPEFSSYLAKLLIEEWDKNHLVEWQIEKEKIISPVQQCIAEDLNKEKELEKEVQKMLDELENTHPNQFERYKMYPLLKKKLAQKKGFIL